MTLIALTDCCRRLAVDRKTLHRWLAQAELSLQTHPLDARSKGLTSDQLLLLARTHHRRLEGLPVEPVTSTALATVSALPELPAELLFLLHTLSAVPEQITALEQHLAQLTVLVQPLARPTVTAAPRQQPTRAGKPRPAPKAKAGRSLAPTQVIPRVEYVREGHYVVLCPKAGLLPLAPDSPEWFAWLAKHSSFRFVGKLGYFSAHHEWRLKSGAWRAHRHIRNHSYSLRLAPTHELTIAVLEQAAAALQAHLR